MTARDAGQVPADQNLLQALQELLAFHPCPALFPRPAFTWSNAAYHEGSCFPLRLTVLYPKRVINSPLTENFMHEICLPCVADTVSLSTASGVFQP
jgi:hypothetical protein